MCWLCVYRSKQFAEEQGEADVGNVSDTRSATATTQRLALGEHAELGEAGSGRRGSGENARTT